MATTAHERTRKAVHQALRDHEGALSLTEFKHLADYLEVFVRRSLTGGTYTDPVREFDLAKRRIQILSIKTLLERELRKLRKLHRAIASSVSDWALRRRSLVLG